MKQINDFRIVFSESMGRIALLEKVEEGYYFPILSSKHMFAIEHRLALELGHSVCRDELETISQFHKKD